MGKTIIEIQEELISEFEILGDDYESKIYYLIEIGKTLPLMDESKKLEDNLVGGCASKVWLTAREEGGRVIFDADSNTDITKGLISLLIRIYSSQTPDDIINNELYFLEKIGISQIIGSQRSNGLAFMIKQIKFYAIAFKAQLENN